MINQVADSGAPRDVGRRSQILDAALHVMAEHGFRGASIKRIAQHAGLKSPALIYWYFKDKQALLEAVLHRMAPFLDTVAGAETSLDDPPERVLPTIAMSFLHTVQQPLSRRFVRIILSEVVRHPAMATFFAERGPLVVLNFLERYLSRQIELGRLKPHDPRAAARSFMGMLIVYAVGREIFPAIGAGFPDAEVYGQQVTAIFLNGLAAASESSNRLA